MCDVDTKHQFLELRAKGWSLARIAERLKSTENLYRLSVLLRSEIRKACEVPLRMEDATAAEERNEIAPFLPCFCLEKGKGAPPFVSNPLSLFVPNLVW